MDTEVSPMAESVSKQLLSAVTEGHTNQQQTPQPQSALQSAAEANSSGSQVGVTAGCSRGGGGSGSLTKKQKQQNRRRLGTTGRRAVVVDSGKADQLLRIAKNPVGRGTNIKVSGSVKQELKKSLAQGGGGPTDAAAAAAAVVPERQKRTSRRGSNFNYNLEDSEDSDFGKTVFYIVIYCCFRGSETKESWS